MELIFVRHGETVFNKNNQLMGQRIDAPLDNDGIIQIKALLPNIPNDFSLIYSSPLKRTLQTALLIADHFHKQIEIRKELTERDFGSLTGKSWVEIDAGAGKALSELDANLKYDYTDYGGESVAQVRNRLEAFLVAVKAQHGTERIVITTHYGIIALMESLYSPTGHHAMDNASLHKFEI